MIAEYEENRMRLVWKLTGISSHDCQDEDTKRDNVSKWKARSGISFPGITFIVLKCAGREIVLFWDDFLEIWRCETDFWRQGRSIGPCFVEIRLSKGKLKLGWTSILMVNFGQKDFFWWIRFFIFKKDIKKEKSNNRINYFRSQAHSLLSQEYHIKILAQRPTKTHIKFISASNSGWFL